MLAHDIADYILAVLVMTVNVMIICVLTRVNNRKRVLNVFLGNMTVSNLISGVVHFVRALCTSLDVVSTAGCHFVRIMIKTTAFMYATILLYIYVELYISTKRMDIYKALFSGKGIVWLIVLSWTFWLAVSSSGITMVSDAHWSTEIPFTECHFGSSTYRTGYTALMVSAWVVLIVSLLIVHVLTYRLMDKAFRPAELQMRRAILVNQPQRTCDRP